MQLLTDTTPTTDLTTGLQNSKFLFYLQGGPVQQGYILLLKSCEETNVAMASTLVLVLKVLMILVFASWVCVWILKPTEIWTKSWRTAEERARTTFFGYNGLDFVVYSFPIIAVAIIGFVHLHLKDEEPRFRRTRFSIISLSNPVIVHSPLGVLSGGEILVGALFFLFLAWTFYAHISNDFQKMEPVKSLKLNVWQLKLMKVGIRFGLLAEACLALLLLPILRRMALFRLLGLQFEASVRYHVWLGTAMVFFATLHGSIILFIWGVKNSIQDKVGLWQKTGRVYLAGEIGLATGLVIWITSLPQVRRRQFELFYYTHHLYVIFLVFFSFHAGDRHFYMIFGGILLFALDKLLRIIQSRAVTCVLSARILPCKVLELTLPKPFGLKYTPTSIIFMKIPSISKFEWHPFSVTSSSNVDEDTISVMIRCDGGWTSNLYNLITSDADQMKCIPVAVEGPYGPDSLNFLRCDSLLLVAGGIGITPLISILQEISYIHGSNKNSLLSNIQLICVVKKSQDISLLNPIWPILQNFQSQELVHAIKVKIFVTQEQRSSRTLGELVNELSHVQTIDFDTKCSNYTISGPENFLWMAAIAGFCSIVFLILLGCLSRTILNSEKRASDKKTPSWVPDLILICSFAIATTCTILATVISRWRKMKSEISQKPTKQAKEVEISCLEARGDLEEHEIHYGHRPNLRDLLSQFPIQSGGSDVGVIVCGPESMNESVASFCRQNSQGLNICANKRKPNFSFHSLNFAL
ncbi:hypothetical protein NE237_021689 [Protea cynaroides]|uniref:FAD-binding FR-type domain-containing protein n=1 Tax=Protea cynaroides TaxID=273540 RepID=A0A9Q0HDT5_9MAGN|nr:hypothetical protein NE237_021689 [Protea cynaroides]